jgi:hypothetical protein
LKFVIFIDDFLRGVSGASFPQPGSLPSNALIYAASGCRPAGEQAVLAERAGFTVLIN